MAIDIDVVAAVRNIGEDHRKIGAGGSEPRIEHGIAGGIGAAGLHAIDEHPGGEIGAIGGVEGHEDAVVEERAVGVGGMVVVPEIVGADAQGGGAELEVDEGLGAGGVCQQQGDHGKDDTENGGRVFMMSLD